MEIQGTQRSKNIRVKLVDSQISKLIAKLQQLEARIYSGEKTVSSISGAGKTGQLHVKE